MRLSARNQIPGIVVSVKTGAVMAEVVVDIGRGLRMVSEISASSAKALKLKKGSKVMMVVKSTEVMIGIPD
jgi:molybdate transport system regulatory protein